ncbi:hypothetical protein BD779DRAFT_1489248 [Infundibulicybe gibba]|nr:hypothetical protein BD779DRAFT_1489248 [Infundibulicybe gibba]
MARVIPGTFRSESQQHTHSLTRNKMSSPLRKGLMKNCYVIIGGVVAGAAWYTARLATGPTVVWTKANPTPWNTVKPEENTKIMAVNQKFNGSWSRDKL